MTSRDSQIVVERINMAQACAIVGLKPRRMQQKAERHEIPEAIKIDGLWTFDEVALRAWLKKLKEQQCPSANDVGGAAVRRIPSGATASSTGARGLRASSGAGRYEQAMSTLLQRVSRKTSSG